ncbi:Hypothetical protein RADP37_01865 [Roseomonas mucosa]|uniref:DUF3429 domain-containing protein n=1 Tax=Roseomonas mucosa TaxID=207340 RepID=A0A4Y1MZ43_9PROT|nr:DUF3429 domain-containing protein [Roseomonas mucosa]AWV23211.1 Hypothetical protein RADP37_01865 [Roseomonas mucosa]MDT8353585.1 DUF3429 domain-containing protein [Roseomonas mucosa]MDU7523649.1 DUF3429 domain-containing protein [Roseomonas mucosa]
MPSPAQRLNKPRIRASGGWRAPPAARILGLAGLVPFFGLAMLSLSGEAWTRPPLLLYGATILSFLGAIHWGVTLRAPESEAGWDWPRLTLGVLPPLLAWVALLLPPYWTALLLILGLMLTVIVESWAARVHAVAPRSWLRLRWLLSIGASSSLFFGVLLLL